VPKQRTFVALAVAMAAGLALPAVCGALPWPGFGDRPEEEGSCPWERGEKEPLRTARMQERDNSAPVQSHSMIHTCCTPRRDRQALIAAAKRSGAEIVRLDVEVHAIVTPTASGYRYDFSKLDAVVGVARRHDIRILGILSGTPAGMEICPAGTSPEDAWKCAPADPEEYARHVLAIMEHAGASVYAWEFWNEPDESYMYVGSAAAYGRALGAIHRRSAGRFLITTGGVADVWGGLRFLRRAIDAGARFDIGNVHLRGTGLREQARRAARFFGDFPLWVTEHGYPSDPEPDDQARHLRASLPALREGGADEVFVTLRDIDEFGADSPFASEGILGKPAWDVVVGINRQAAEPPSCLRQAPRPYDNYFMNPSCKAKARVCEFPYRAVPKRSMEWEQLRYPSPYQWNLRWPKTNGWRSGGHGPPSATCLGAPPTTCRSPSGWKTDAGLDSWAGAPGGGSATG
jgi:hypothetical protein